MRQIAFSALPSVVGEELGVSDWFVMDQSTVNAFAEATGDFEWIHVDVERANREYGGPIAHGFLTLSMIPRLMEDTVQITGVRDGLNYGLDRVRFTNAVRVGKRIRLRQKLTGLEPRGEGSLMRYEFIIEIEGEAKPALVAESLVIRYPELSEA